MQDGQENKRKTKKRPKVTENLEIFGNVDFLS